ncbi:hypothetical protein XELAEV_18038101mg [Xenopus laevis]|uniref:Uncharacterized protein n=1 Tax=Xenopus laevis TaxID=8355 RepID=A0A974C535_XENLA|nr:hypothetical protein XELAEV_18038101mg [Xenopus laevis]
MVGQIRNVHHSPHVGWGGRAQHHDSNMEGLRLKIFAKVRVSVALLPAPVCPHLYWLSLSALQEMPLIFPNGQRMNRGKHWGHCYKPAGLIMSLLSSLY